MTEQTQKRLSKGKKVGGRPTEYKPEFCQLMIEFFNVPLTRSVLIKRTEKALREGFSKPEVIEEYEEKGEILPVFLQFARTIGVIPNTLLVWADKHPEFKVSYNLCKEIQKNHLMQNGCQGNYNAAFGIFTAKNITDMKDQPTTIINTGDQHVHHTKIELNGLDNNQLIDLLTGRQNGLAPKSA